MTPQLKTSDLLKAQPSKSIKHLDSKYEVKGFKCWDEKDGFHVELIMREKSINPPPIFSLSHKPNHCSKCGEHYRSTYHLEHCELNKVTGNYFPKRDKQ